MLYLPFWCSYGASTPASLVVVTVQYHIFTSEQKEYHGDRTRGLRSHDINYSQTPACLRDENLVVAVTLLIQPMRAIPYRCELFKTTLDLLGAVLVRLGGGLEQQRNFGVLFVPFCL
jgi:hypothetical protein